MAKKKIEPVEVELEIDLEGDEIDDLEDLELDEPLIEDDEDTLLDDDEADDKMVQFLEILNAEAHADEEDDEQITLEAGDWYRVVLAWQSDL